MVQSVWTLGEKGEGQNRAAMFELRPKTEVKKKELYTGEVEIERL